jgi:VWFA-related protein
LGQGKAVSRTAFGKTVLAVLGALVALAAFVSTLSGQVDRPPPSFPAQAEAVTVDVVVLDPHGQPVHGLGKDDFTLLEDGRPQPIVAFESRCAPAGTDTPAAADPGPARVVSNLPEPGRPGRVLILAIDDLGLTPPMAQELGPALARWIREQAAPMDEITIRTTSGEPWWSAEVAAGRADLLAVLGRLRGRRLLPPSTEWVSEVEAYQIVVHESRGQAAELVSSRGDVLDITSGPEEPSPPPLLAVSESVLDRVAHRLLEARSCVLVRAPRPAMSQCKQLAMTRAEEVYGVWTRRAAAVLDLLTRASVDVAGRSGRKSILLVSDDFLRDVALERRFRDVVNAAQRSNTALYFSRASGLTGPAFYSASGGRLAHPSDVATLGAEQMQLAVAGGLHLAEASGGASVTTSNDLAAGLERMAQDATAYYLLGYQPTRAPDGRWHRLDVKVARPGLQVRARRGYVSGSSTTGVIPLRAASYLQGPDGAGSARVLLVVEIDGGRVQVAGGPAGGTARLELSIIAVSRDQARVLPLAQSLDLKLGPRDKGWWALFREVRLPPGVAQLRVRVRDRASGAQGAVVQRVEIPDVEGPYLSTPLLSDAIQPPREKGEPPQIVPSARRTFPARGTLYCQYELFSFGGRDLPGVPRVMGGYTLTRSTGEVVTTVPPTLIATDGTRVVRRLALPLHGMAPGTYDLVLTVEDHLAKRTLTAHERFEIAHQLP